MSIFSGKCDVYDHFCMIGCDENTTEEDIEKEIKNTNFYIRTRDGKRHRLMINCIRDLVPYYPYLIVVGAFSNSHSTIELSNRSFVDSEEDEIMSWRLNDLKRIYRRCKREKKEFNFDYVKKVQGDFLTSDPNYKLMIKIVSDNKDNTCINDLYKNNIHNHMSEYYRNELYETMIAYGYSKIESYNWCFNEFVFSEDRMTRLNKK